MTETNSDTYAEVGVDGETVTDPPEDLLAVVQDAIDVRDLNILIYLMSEIVLMLYGMARDADVDDFTLSRRPDIDHQQLAGQSTYPSYGQVGHSPARYNVPGGYHRRIEHVLVRGNKLRRHSRSRLAV